MKRKLQSVPHTIPKDYLRLVVQLERTDNNVKVIEEIRNAIINCKNAPDGTRAIVKIEAICLCDMLSV